MRFAFAAVLFLAAPAWAQEGFDEMEGGGADTARAPIGAAAEASAPAEAGEASAASPAAVVHAADESVYVVQRRAYSKKGMVELTPMLYTSLNNKFVGHAGPGVSLAYHMRENLAVELTSSLPYTMYAFYSGMVFELYDKETLTPEVVDLKQMRYFGALSLQFSALYGKFEFYDHLLDYDFYATAGFGLTTTVETCAPPGQGGCGEDDFEIGRGLRAPEMASDRYKFSGNLGGGLRVFFADWIGLRVEVRDIVYSDKAAEANLVTTDIRNNVLLMLGVSFLI